MKRAGRFLKWKKRKEVQGEDLAAKGPWKNGLEIDQNL